MTTDTPARQPQYIITETVFNHVVAALRDNRQYDVAEYLIHGASPHTNPPAPRPPCEECIYQERIDKAAKAAREQEDIHISNEIDRILSEHPARIVNHLFIMELKESLRAQQEAVHG